MQQLWTKSLIGICFGRTARIFAVGASNFGVTNAKHNAVGQCNLSIFTGSILLFCTSHHRRTRHRSRNVPNHHESTKNGWSNVVGMITTDCPFSYKSCLSYKEASRNEDAKCDRTGKNEVFFGEWIAEETVDGMSTGCRAGSTRAQSTSQWQSLQTIRQTPILPSDLLSLVVTLCLL